MRFTLKRYFAVIPAIAIAAFFTAGRGHAQGGFTVKVVGFKAEARDLSETISLVGTLQANEVVEIKSEISGTIEGVYFTEGDAVKQGDLLIEIDKKKIQAGYVQAEADLKLAQTTVDRYKALIESKAVSQQEYDQATAAFESAKASLDLVNEQLKDAAITAPFDGVMGQRLVSVGQFISQGASLSYLVSQNPIKAEFHVPERFLGEVEKGQKISMKVAAYKEEVFSGELYFIDPQIDALTRTALLKAYVPNDDGRLRSGMFANLDLIVNVKTGAIVIPETALITKGDTVLVYKVKDDQTVEQQAVTPGVRKEGVVEITSGLAPGDVVVTEGHQKLGPGATVEVRFEDLTEKKVYEII